MKSYVKNIPVSPRKLRKFVNAVRSRSIEKAFRNIMAIHTPTKSIIDKAIRSAIANGEYNHSVNKNNMYIKEIFVGEGSITKFRDIKGRGRMGLIRKRRSNLTVILGKEELSGTKN